LNGQRDRRETNWRLYWRLDADRSIKLLDMTTGWHHLALRWFPQSQMLQVYPGWGAWFLHAPWRNPDAEREFDEDSYGVAIHKDAFWWYWGDVKILHWPWDWTHFRTSHLNADGSWKHECKRRGQQLSPNACLQEPKHAFYNRNEDKDLFRETHPYHYMLDNGEVQHVQATISVSEMEWRLRKATWFPWIRKLHRSIEVSFSDEVGERAGSWKGGCVGCGYEMLPYEEPKQTLRRMQRERRFR
jgi:hypothetical protein